MCNYVQKMGSLREELINLMKTLEAIGKDIQSNSFSQTKKKDALQKSRNIQKLLLHLDDAEDRLSSSLGKFVENRFGEILRSDTWLDNFAFKLPQTHGDTIVVDIAWFYKNGCEIADTIYATQLLDNDIRDKYPLMIHYHLYAIFSCVKPSPLLSKMLDSYCVLLGLTPPPSAPTNDLLSGLLSKLLPEGADMGAITKLFSSDFIGQILPEISSGKMDMMSICTKIVEVIKEKSPEMMEKFNIEEQMEKLKQAGFNLNSLMELIPKGDSEEKESPKELQVV